ncbi:uncharacterized protein G2W53_009880 [Senna tora]|uniref:Uncharacterized protein n=1 Tax=Senna tora TaxID=362788 RepID=A0A835CAN7_9FABA|nr:uncharacterized protein G2W53_009880 [Senna tora]
MFQLESSWHGRIVDHVLTYSGRQIAIGSQKPSQITRQKTCCASETCWFALYLRTGVDLMMELESSRHGGSVDHVLTYSEQQITDESQKPSRITRQKSCCARIGVVKAWEESGSCLNIIRTKNHDRISETVTNYKAKDLLRKGVEHVGSRCICEPSGFYVQIGVIKAWEERGSCINIFRMKNHDRISETFTNYEAKDLLRNSVRVVFANRSGFDAGIGVVKAWEEHGSCLNIFRTTNHSQILETFTNYEAKDLLCKSRLDLRNLHDLRGKRLVVKAREERGPCLNIFWTKNHDRISETFTNYEAKDLLRESNTSVRVVLRTVVDLMFQLESSWHGRSEDHVLTYSRREFVVIS